MLRQRADGADPLVMKEIRHVVRVCGYRWCGWFAGGALVPGAMAGHSNESNQRVKKRSGRLSPDTNHGICWEATAYRQRSGRVGEENVPTLIC